jgi:hypothetical protein
MKNIKFITLFLVLILVLSLSFISCKKPVPKVVDTTTTQKETQNLDFVPNYEIVNELENIREDKGITYFILINPVDLSTEAFIGQIKNIIKQVVKEKIKKENISIEIFDKREALDIVLKDKNSEDTLLQNHYIAKYVGESNDEIYRDTLYIFPVVTKGGIGAGKYFDVIEFDPYNW